MIKPTSLPAFLRLMAFLAVLASSAAPLGAQQQPALPGLLEGAPGGWQAEAPEARVEVDLLAADAVAVPGQSIRLGLRQTIAPGWHTYWRNPGDSGAASELDWQLPDGVSAGPVLWPAPEAIPYFDMMNFGYEDEVLLMADIAVPADWPAGTPLPVRLAASWLVCADICIPESAELALDLPTGPGPAAPHPLHGELFRQAAAELPVASPWPAVFAAGEESIDLELTGLPAGIELAGARFFPYEQGVVMAAAPQPVVHEGDGLLLRLAAGSVAPAARLEGVLVIEEKLADGAARHAFEIAAPPGDITMAGGGWGELGMMMLFALAGGLILNAMPCVFPVLSMKALHLVRHAGAPGVRMQGIAYTLGVLVTFGGLALLLWALKAGGAAVGWGFQLQSPPIVTALAYLMFVLGLWLAGLFEGATALAGIGQRLTMRDGPLGSFLTGVLAVVVASPCTAPFMAGAIGFAMTRDGLTILAIFMALGLGLALPYLLLSFSPVLQRCLPRPGPWMVRFRQFLAFPMFAAAAWLVWVLTLQVGTNGLLAVLLGFVLLAMAIWLWQLRTPLPRSIAAGVLLLALVPPFLAERLPPPGGNEAAETRSAAFEPYSAGRLEALRAEGRPVLVNMTAAWCLTCLVNERVALSDGAVVAAMEARDIAYLKGDWTSYDPAITAFLEAFGRAGVPLYVLYPAGDGEPAVLPQLLTPAIVLDAIESAAARTLADATATGRG